MRWSATDVPFERRLDRSSKYAMMPLSLEIHWLSIINSFVLVLLLVGFLTVILMRVLKNDFSRHAQGGEGRGGKGKGVAPTFSCRPFRRGAFPPRSSGRPPPCERGAARAAASCRPDRASPPPPPAPPPPPLPL